MHPYITYPYGKPECIRVTYGGIHVLHVGWLRLVGSLKVKVFFAEEPYKRDYILRAYESI